MTEPIDPMLGRPLTPAERAALNELMQELALSREERAATSPRRRSPEHRAELARRSRVRTGILTAADLATPIPLTAEERIALGTLRRLVARGVIGPTDPA